MLQNMGNHCEDSLKHELEAAFKEAIEDVIEELIAEIVESIILMGVGSAVTSSISYILPALVVAKKTAELANAGLDLVGF
jgi:small ligand-binding sensory domain FIST